MLEFRKIISDYDGKYETFARICQQLKIEDRLKSGVCGFWSPKQVVDHLTGWNREAYHLYTRNKNGEAVDLEYDDDAFNANAVVELSSLDWNDSLKDLYHARNELMRFIQQLTREDIVKSSIYASWMEGLAEDFQLHSGQLKPWIQGTDSIDNL